MDAFYPFIRNQIRAIVRVCVHRVQWLLVQEKICVADGTTIDAIHHLVGCVCVFFVLFFAHSSVASYFNQNVQLQYASLLSTGDSMGSMGMSLPSFLQSQLCLFVELKCCASMASMTFWVYFGFVFLK